MTIDPVVAATFSLGAFAILSFCDGVMLHLVVERLPLRPASRLEHLLHTARALLFPAILLTYFGGHASLVIAWTLLAVDQMIEIWDMAIERRSRAHTSGLPSREYVIHGLLTTLRATAVVFVAVIDRRVHDTSLLDALVSALVPGAIVAALAHVALATDAGRALLARIGSPA